jgi:hypothetical protein
MAQGERNYCVFLNPGKYNRNVGCRRHDNLYGIAGGGSERDRRRVDREFYEGMRAEGDPMAFFAWAACTLFGWFFWNYHPGTWLWQGQLLRRFKKARW